MAKTPFKAAQAPLATAKTNHLEVDVDMIDVRWTRDQMLDMANLIWRNLDDSGGALMVPRLRDGGRKLETEIAAGASLQVARSVTSNVGRLDGQQAPNETTTAPTTAQSLINQHGRSHIRPLWRNHCPDCHRTLYAPINHLQHSSWSPKANTTP